MIYKFYKEVATAYSCYVEADTLEEAKEKLDNCDFYDDMEWSEDDGGESTDVYTATRVGESVEDIDDGEYETLEEWNAYSYD